MERKVEIVCIVYKTSNPRWLLRCAYGSCWRYNVTYKALFTQSILITYCMYKVEGWTNPINTTDLHEKIHMHVAWVSQILSWNSPNPYTCTCTVNDLCFSLDQIHNCIMNNSLFNCSFGLQSWIQFTSCLEKFMSLSSCLTVCTVSVVTN